MALKKEAEEEIRRIFREELAKERGTEVEKVEKLEIEKDEITDDDIASIVKDVEEPDFCGGCHVRLKKGAKKCPECGVEFEE